jgi:hypothetical protein
MATGSDSKAICLHVNLESNDQAEGSNDGVYLDLCDRKSRRSSAAPTPPATDCTCLIDYWSNSDPAGFYPEFPESWTPLQFYTRVFGAVCNECSVQLPELREGTFTSNWFDSHSQTTLSHGQGQEDETRITEQSMQIVRPLFKQEVVRFGLIL